MQDWAVLRCAIKKTMCFLSVSRSHWRRRSSRPRHVDFCLRWFLSAVWICLVFDATWLFFWRQEAEEGLSAVSRRLFSVWIAGYWETFARRRQVEFIEDDDEKTHFFVASLWNNKGVLACLCYPLRRHPSIFQHASFSSIFQPSFSEEPEDMESEAGGQSSDWPRCVFLGIQSCRQSSLPKCRYWRSTESLCPEMSSTSRLDKLQALRRGDSQTSYDFTSRSWALSLQVTCIIASQGAQLWHLGKMDSAHLTFVGFVETSRCLRLGRNPRPRWEKRWKPVGLSENVGLIFPINYSHFS